MDEKIKISLPKTTLNVLKKDCVDFLILKENGKPNMNAFVNTLILNFYEAFSASEETLHQDLKNAISIVPDYYKDKVLNNVLKILTKKSEEDVDKKNTATLSFKPTKISQTAVMHIEQVAIQNESISSFYRRMFNAYASKTKNEREKIIHIETFLALQRAIKLGVQACIKLDKNHILNELSVYSIVPAKDELFNYILGYAPSNNVTVRLAKIKSVSLLSSTISIPTENKALLDRQIACAPQYPMYKSDKHLIKVELTDAGIKLFEKIYLYRPNPIAIEGNVYTFDCSASQALYYFERFGNNALIISPKKLGIDMRNYHYFALKKYNSFYKERI